MYAEIDILCSPTELLVTLRPALQSDKKRYDHDESSVGWLHLSVQSLSAEVQMLMRF